jgi:hypothetical protein
MEMAKKKSQQRDRPDLDGRLNLVEEQEEIDRWDKFAEERGLSLSAWVRMTLRAAVRKVEPT